MNILVSPTTLMSSVIFDCIDGMHLLQLYNQLHNANWDR
jgi:hypothetical protein